MVTPVIAGVYYWQWTYRHTAELNGMNSPENVPNADFYLNFVGFKKINKIEIQEYFHKSFKRLVLILFYITTEYRLIKLRICQTVAIII